MFPDTQRSMMAKNIDETLKQTGDPINLFYDAMDAIGTNMITPKQYKGVIQMLNNAIQGTDYKTLGRQMFMIREALENDFKFLIKAIESDSNSFKIIKCCVFNVLKSIFEGVFCVKLNSSSVNIKLPDIST